MMIIDPVVLGDVACTRASPKWVFDRAGTLVQVPANTLAVTYDPSDLTKAPYALAEQAATNVIPYSSDFGAWSRLGGGSGNPPEVSLNAAPGPDGSLTAARIVFNSNSGLTLDDKSILACVPSPVTLGKAYTWSMLVKGPAGGNLMVRGVGTVNYTLVILTGAWQLIQATETAVAPNFEFGLRQGTNVGLILGSLTVDVMFAQMEIGTRATSYIPTAGVAVTRAADVIASGAGLVYSNVPITETAYSSTATYAQNVIVYDPATYMQYQSLIANNTGKALTDITSWTPLLTTVNRWSMFDQYNNTQTSNAEEIIVVLQPKALAQGVYIGNADASDIRISTYDPTDGVVHQETQDLIISDSGSSFYNWCFKRIRKKSYAVSVQLPPYYTGLVTISLRKPGGTAKCGMCVLGPLVDVGLSQYGLSREIKDYSTVNFNFDGTSNVVKRNFAKIMDVDVLIDNVYIDSIIESLENYRQKPVAWIGAAAYGSACLYGTYTSFKNVIQYPTQSAMNLQIQGTV
jgi:hypothetical protein